MRLKRVESRELDEILKSQYSMGIQNVIVHLRAWAIRVAECHRISDKTLKKEYKAFVDKYYNPRIMENQVEVIAGLQTKNCTVGQLVALLIYGLGNDAPQYYVRIPNEIVPFVLCTRLNIGQSGAIVFELSIRPQQSQIHLAREMQFNG